MELKSFQASQKLKIKYKPSNLMHNLLIILNIYFCIIFSGILYANPVEPIRQVNTNEKIIALTFDDGPHKINTPKILAILAKYQVPATFYVTGISAKSYPKIMQNIIKAGHEIGNHSMYHKKLNQRSLEFILQDLVYTNKIIRILGYTGPITFRAPYGLTSKNLNLAANQLSMPHVLFTYLPKDWENPLAPVIVNRVLNQIKPGFIITLHDGGGNRKNTILATEILIKKLHQMGYKFVTVSDLISKEL